MHTISNRVLAHIPQASVPFASASINSIRGLWSTSWAVVGKTGTFTVYVYLVLSKRM